MVGGAYVTGGRSSACRGCPKGRFITGLGAGGAGLDGTMFAEDIPPGGFGAGLFGMRLPLIAGELGDVTPVDV